MINVKQLGVDGCQLIAAVTLSGGALHVESLESLAADLGSTRKKLRTALSKLVAAGVIVVSSKRNAGTEIRLANLQPREEKPTKPKREEVKQPRKAEQVKTKEERTAEYWEKLTEKFATVLFDTSATWDNALKRKWLRLVDDHGEEVADRLVAAIEAADWIRDRGNLNLILLIANADKILAGRYGKVFKENETKQASNIKRSKAALCVGGDSARNDFLKLFKT